jgi:hypothetical protein
MGGRGGRCSESTAARPCRVRLQVLGRGRGVALVPALGLVRAGADGVRRRARSASSPSSVASPRAPASRPPAAAARSRRFMNSGSAQPTSAASSAGVLGPALRRSAMSKLAISSSTWGWVWGLGGGGLGGGRAAVPPGARGSGRPAAPTSVPKRPSLILHRPTRARLRPTRIFMMSTGLGSSALALASSWEGSGAGWSLMGASGAGPQRRRGARAGGAGARGRAELDRDPPRRSCGWWRCRPATAAASPSRSGCCCARVRAARGRSDVARRACGGARGENSAPAAGRGC